MACRRQLSSRVSIWECEQLGSCRRRRQGPRSPVQRLVLRFPCFHRFYRFQHPHHPLFLGEATAVRRSFSDFTTIWTLKLGIPVAQWRTQVIHLNKDEYMPGRAPVIFIETSNMNDHIGLLNILVAAVPLLAKSGVLYTESLFRGQKGVCRASTRRYHNCQPPSRLLPGRLSFGFHYSIQQTS